MPQTSVIREAVGFSVSSLIELWTLDGTAIGLDTIYPFCNGSSANFQPILFNGVTYTPFPMKLDSMEADGKGSLPRPKLTVSNINGFISALLLQNTTLDGATVIRTRVHARFIDAVNFPSPLPSWVTPDPTATYAPEPWQVNRKISENPQIVQFELASPIESNRVKLPRRQIIANSCAAWRYRQAGTCGYTGVPVADAANRTFTGSFYNMTLNDRGVYDSAATYTRGDYVTTYSTLPQFSSIPFLWVCTTNGTTGTSPSASSSRWVADSCAKTSAACKLRFVDTPLRISAFPGVARSPWTSRA